MDRKLRRLISLRFRENRSILPKSGISGYRTMWVVVLFDLPVGTTTERRRATRFRKDIMAEGFYRKQWSVYMKFFPSRAQAEAAANRIGARVPPFGNVTTLFLTDRQFGMMRNFSKGRESEADKKPEQLALF